MAPQNNTAELQTKPGSLTKIENFTKYRCLRSWSEEHHYMAMPIFIMENLPAELSAGDRLVFQALYSQFLSVIGKYGSQDAVRLNFEKVAAFSGLSKRSIRNSINRLVESGLITKDLTTTCKTGSEDTYASVVHFSLETGFFTKAANEAFKRVKPESEAKPAETAPELNNSPTPSAETATQSEIEQTQRLLDKAEQEITQFQRTPQDRLESESDHEFLARLHACDAELEALKRKKQKLVNDIKRLAKKQQLETEALAEAQKAAEEAFSQNKGYPIPMRAKARCYALVRSLQNRGCVISSPHSLANDIFDWSTRAYGFTTYTSFDHSLNVASKLIRENRWSRSSGGVENFSAF